MSVQAKISTKAATVTRMLSREKGATLAELGKATAWKPHSCRAFLAGIRKKSRVVKEQRSDGQTAYRIEAVASDVIAE